MMDFYKLITYINTYLRNSYSKNTYSTNTYSIGLYCTNTYPADTYCTNTYCTQVPSTYLFYIQRTVSSTYSSCSSTTYSLYSTTTRETIQGGVEQRTPVGDLRASGTRDLRSAQDGLPSQGGSRLVPEILPRGSEQGRPVRQDSTLPHIIIKLEYLTISFKKQTIENGCFN